MRSSARLVDLEPVLVVNPITGMVGRAYVMLRRGHPYASGRRLRRVDEGLIWARGWSGDSDAAKALLVAEALR